MYLLFDIGATHMRLAVSSGARLGKSVIVDTPENYKAGLELFKLLSEGLLKNTKPVLAIGGIASPVSEKNKIASFIKKDWKNKSILKDLTKILGCKVILGNDAALAALGEAKYGSGRNKKIVAYLTISSGIGGARVVNGDIDNNSIGFEPKLLLQSRNMKNFGSLASGTAIKTVYQQPGEKLKNKEAWKEVELWLTMGFNNVIVLWSPDILVVGGPVAANRNISFGRIEKALRKNLKILRHRPKIVKAMLGQKAGLLGALSLAKKYRN
ncbi:MAG: ROK family protein [Candidatus Doudnabacteria bacterium]|nr:ROK family protein [Candidatus Doudnabacteria bacterium]